MSGLELLGEEGILLLSGLPEEEATSIESAAISVVGGLLFIETPEPQQGTATIRISCVGLADIEYRQRGTAEILIHGSGHQPSRGIKRRIVVCDKEGTVYDRGRLPHAVMGDVTWEANTPDNWSFTTSMQSETVEAIMGPTPAFDDLGMSEPYREATLWRGDDCLSWGPMHTVELRDALVNVTGAGLLEYYNRRFVGFAGPIPNYLDDNADFSQGEASWAPVIANMDSSTFGPETADAYIEVAPHPVTGELALHIHDHTPGPDDDPQGWIAPFMFKSHAFDAQGYPFTVTASADCYVEYMIKPNMWTQGISLGEYPHAWTDIFNDFKQTSASSLDTNEAPSSIDFASYDHGINRHTTSLSIPTATTGVIHFKLFGVKGDTWWSFPKLVFDQAFDFKKEDIGDIAWKLSDHITGQQDTPLWPLLEVRNGGRTDTYGKSDLLIDADSLTTGITKTVRYPWSQRTNGLSALQDLTAVQDGIQFWMDYHPGDSERRRIFRVEKFKGTKKPHLPLRYQQGRRSNLTDLAYTFQGQQGSNSIILASADGGINAPEGSAIDPTRFAGGLTLEEVLSAPQEAGYSSFDIRAAYLLRQKVHPVTLALKMPASPYFEDGLRVGDRVPVYIDYGSLHLTEELMWITRMTLTTNDYLELVVQYWPAYVPY